MENKQNRYYQKSKRELENLLMYYENVLNETQNNISEIKQFLLLLTNSDKQKND